ncbi:hypothetical protein [Massilia sp. TN1-12]|uniref:hypothetical protein n=1 Tax=Massilia paldalensis TaxID=3377675 RepID=UPI00385024A8
METTQESFPDQGVPEPLVAASVAASVAAASAAAVPARLSLPPKGACWYCDKPLDSVRRFCGKSCATSFDEEAEYTR